MEPQQALRILIDVCRQAPLPDPVHDQWKAAANTLADYIKANTPEPEAEPEE